jgi:transcriptional regulator with XRE-family HTH domain
MIKNPTELKSAQQKLNEFKFSLEKIQASRTEIEPIVAQMKEDTIRSYIEEFEKEIRDYEELKKGKACFISIDSVHNLHELLIKTRIAFKISQAELATRIGTSQQQVQRWESGNYETITWSKMLDVIDALGISVPVGNLFLQQPKFLPVTNSSEEQISNAISLVKERKMLLVIGEN